MPVLRHDAQHYWDESRYALAIAVEWYRYHRPDRPDRTISPEANVIAERWIAQLERVAFAHAAHSTDPHANVVAGRFMTQFMMILAHSTIGSLSMASHMGVSVS